MRETPFVLTPHLRFARVLPRLLVALTLGLAGCGGGAEVGSDDPASTAPESPTQTTSETVEEAPAADDCGVAVPEMLAATSMLGSVTDISVSGCELATVTTNLGSTPDDVDSATGVCSYAAHEASGHGVATTSVVAADGTELARGTTGDDCAGVLAS